MSVYELQHCVEHLPEAELKEFAQWFNAYRANRPNAPIGDVGFVKPDEMVRAQLPDEINT